MKKILLATFLASMTFLTGCTGGYTLDTPVSPPLNLLDPLDHSEYFDSGFEMNHAISVTAANNLAAHL